MNEDHQVSLMPLQYFMSQPKRLSTFNKEPKK